VAGLSELYSPPAARYSPYDATEPVFAPDTTWGGLRYPLAGAGQFQTTSLLDYCRQNDPAEITYLLAERLFQSLRRTWGQHTPCPNLQSPPQLRPPAAR
jgi:hypothetical protein